MPDLFADPSYLADPAFDVGLFGMTLLKGADAGLYYSNPGAYGNKFPYIAMPVAGDILPPLDDLLFLVGPLAAYGAGVALKSPELQKLGIGASLFGIPNYLYVLGTRVATYLLSPAKARYSGFGRSLPNIITNPAFH